MQHKVFNTEQITKDLIAWIREWFEKNGKGCNAVIGISGGKDSTVAAAICVEALGKDHVFGVMMPDGVQTDIEDSLRVVQHLGIDHTICNVGPAIEAVMQSIENKEDYIVTSSQARINLPPRIRMATLYAVSQSMNGRVINTCNLSENICGFSTLYGDHAGDVSLFDQLTVTEIRKIGHYLGLPTDLVEKVPSDGLTGESDEEMYGFTYETLDHYIRTGECEDETVKEKIRERYEKGKFKLDLIRFPHYEPGLPNIPI